MKCFLALFALPFALLAAASTKADTITATADTYVTEHYNLGSYDSVHGSDTNLVIIGSWGGVHATPLVQFDLSAYSGRTVSGNAVFQVYLDYGWGLTQTCTQTIEVHSELSSWDESSTSWTTLPGPNGNMDPTVLDTQTVTFDAQSDYPSRYVSWTIPGSVLQSWIDNPANNHGLVMVSLTTTELQDLWFSSREGDYAPQLVFSTVPEPCAASVLLAASLTMAILRKRKS